MLNIKEFFYIFSKSNPHLSDTSIIFEELNFKGLDEFHNYSTDKRLYEYLEFDSFKNKEESKNYLRKLIERTSGKDILRRASYWFIRDKKDNRLIGTAGLLNLDLNRKSIELGFGIDPKYWGKGYIMEVLEILKNYTFKELKLNRLYGKTMINNERTIKSVLAAGMLKEGIAKEYYCKNGQFIDAWLYGITRKIFLKHQINVSNLENNFTENQIITAVNSVLENNIINSESSMDNTLEWDSMNHILIILAIKKRLNVDLSPNQIMQATSIKKILKILNH